MARRSNRALTGPVESRRWFLQASALSAASVAWSRLPDFAFADEAKPLGLIVREKEPENLEFPFAALDRFLTPNNLFYVRNHFAAPTVDAASSRVRVVGAVRKPLELTHA